MNTTSGLDGQPRPRPPRIFASLLLLVGLVLAAGGVRLASLGGSLYYVIAGVMLIVSAVLLWRGQPWGAYLYGLLTLGTIVWAITESGFDGWALAPRVLPFLVLGLLLLRPKARRALGMSVERPLLASPISWVAIVGLVAICIAVAMRQPYPTLPFAASSGNSDIAARDWQHWGGSAAGTRYVPFDQINASNVDKLEIAWSVRTGVGGAFKATPLQIGDTLYVCLARNIISALDADTGAERWRFDPQLKDSKVGFTTTCRGVTYFKAPEPPADCPERILTATTDARLIAVDAKTGKRCTDFGTNGEVTLLAGMGEVKPGFYYVTSPPTLAKGVAVLGGWVARQRRSGRALRRHPRLRSDQRPLGVGLGSRTSRRADGAARGTDLHARHAERVERLQRRRCARPRLHSDRQRDAGLLRRPSQPGVRALRELGRRARRRDWRGALVVPDDASRHLGLRRAFATGARRSACARMAA